MSMASLVASRLARSGHALPAAAAAAISQAPRAQHAASPLLSGFGPATRAFRRRPHRAITTGKKAGGQGGKGKKK